MKVLLAGRVAEQITFGRITTGASDDLKRVTAIARSMVDDYAMGTHIRSHQVPSQDFRTSEALRQIRDEEVQAIAEEAYRGAHQLLSDHRDLLDLVAEQLARERGHRARRDQGDHGGPPRAQRRDAEDRAGRRRSRRAEVYASRGRRAVPRGRLDQAQIHSGRMFGLIDHIGVATDDLEASLALYEGSMAMPLSHRETVEEQGVEAVLLDVGDCHVELLSPLGPGHPGRQVPRAQGARPPPRRLPRRRHLRRARPAGGRRHRADRLRAAHRHPPEPGRLPSPPLDGRRAHRNRPTREGTLKWQKKTRRSRSGSGSGRSCP